MNEKCIITGIGRVVLVGRDEYQQSHLSFAGPLRYHELIYHFSGTATVRFDGLTMETLPGTVRFLPKGPCSEYTVDRGIPGDCIDVCFDTDLPLSDTAFVKDVSDNKNLPVLFKQLFTVWSIKAGDYHYAALSLLYKILAELSSPGPRYGVIEPAVTYIGENFYRETISVEQLAKKCGISHSYLKRLFLARFGVPPKVYIRQMRMNYACDLLTDSADSVADVARACGFDDVCFFSKQFKSCYGVPPSVFRARCRSSK